MLCVSTSICQELVRKKKVFVVDDNHVLCTVLAMYLERVGFLVQKAFNVEEALKKIEDDCDIIVSDIEMPGQDGFDFMRELKVRKHGAKVIAYSADPSHEKECMDAGFSFFKEKGPEGIRLFVEFIVSL